MRRWCQFADSLRQLWAHWENAAPRILDKIADSLRGWCASADGHDLLHGRHIAGKTGTMARDPTGNAWSWRESSPASWRAATCKPRPPTSARPKVDNFLGFLRHVLALETLARGSLPATAHPRRSRPLRAAPHPVRPQR